MTTDLDEKIDPELPAIFGVRPFPFLLPLAGKVEFWTKTEDGYTYAVMNDRRLVGFKDLAHGGRELTRTLPSGRTLWMEALDGVVHIVKAGSSERPARLMSQTIAGGRLRVVDLAGGSDTLAAYRDGDVLLLIRRHDIRAYALGDGRQLGQAVNARHWTHGRYFRGEHLFYFVSWNGAAVVFEPVTVSPAVEARGVLFVFDRAGLEGPWLFLKSGQFFCSATGEISSAPELFRVRALDQSVRASVDGHRLFVQRELKCFLIELRADVTPRVEVAHAEKQFDPPPKLPTWNLFRVIESIAVHGHVFAFSGRNQRLRWRTIGMGENGKLHVAEVSDAVIELTNKQIFKRAFEQERLDLYFQTAQWPCGTKVFLDGRGVLHLKSHDPNLPEVSLVMADGEVAGWTSDGHRCGPEFFFEGACESNPIAVFKAITQIIRLV